MRVKLRRDTAHAYYSFMSDSQEKPCASGIRKPAIGFNTGMSTQCSLAVSLA